MSEKLPVVGAREIVRVASRLGFVFHHLGKPLCLLRERDGARVVIPIHSGKDINPKTLKGILDDMGVTVEAFRKLL